MKLKGASGHLATTAAAWAENATWLGHGRGVVDPLGQRRTSRRRRRRRHTSGLLTGAGTGLSAYQQLRFADEVHKRCICRQGESEDSSPSGSHLVEFSSGL